MITRIELDGFKTFQNFKLDLAPFQLVVGANGAGKSNLFDALRLLAQLADHDLRSAFQNLRGDAGELFTLLPNGQNIGLHKMRLAAEMFVSQHVEDSWGVEAQITFRRLRYELEITRRAAPLVGLERLIITHESLTAIQPDQDTWFTTHISENKSNLGPVPNKSSRSQPFIETYDKDGTLTISLHQDGHSGHKATVAAKAERSILSGVTNAEYPHAFAAREEMRSWKFLQLNPQVLRQPSSMLATPFISPDGRHLPTALARMQAEDPYILNDLSRDMANLVPGLLKIEVQKDQSRDQYLIQATTQDGRTFSSRVLSDGTLRLLALAALKNDPQHSGVLCLEEPENGVHPFRLKNLLDLLNELATDFSDLDQAIDTAETEPLRQLLVNTHSPALVSHFIQSHSCPSDSAESVLFAYLTTRVDPNLPRSLHVTRVIPVSKQNGSDQKEITYTLAQVIDYLNSPNAAQALAILQGGVAQ